MKRSLFVQKADHRPCGKTKRGFRRRLPGDFLQVEGPVRRAEGVDAQAYWLAFLSSTAMFVFVHQELGRRPRQPAFPGKVVCESRCGSSEQRSGSSVGPPLGGFFVA
jgi:hypothetical protein